MYSSTMRVVTAAVSVMLAAPAVVALAPPAAADPSVSIVGLYGTTDPTYDGVYRQSLAILGLRAAGRQPAPEAVQWLLGQQCADGSFSSYTSSTTCPPYNPATWSGGPDSNATAMASQALLAVGTPSATAAAGRAASYLQSVQLADGSWEYTPGGSGAGDPNSTGLVLLALNAAVLTPAHDPAPYFAGLQVGRSDFDAHDPAADRGAISTAWAPGSPNLLATVQTVPGLSGMALSGAHDLTSGWASDPVAYPTLPPATAAGIDGWVSTYLAGAVGTAGAASFTAADPTSAAWTVLSLAANRTAGSTAQAVEAALAALPASPNPAANGQGALAAVVTGHPDAAGAFADRIAASLTRDTAAPTTTWVASALDVFEGQTVVLTRSALGDGFWGAGRLLLTVAWGDGQREQVSSATRVAHRYTEPGTYPVSVRVADPSGNYAWRRVGSVLVRPDTIAPVTVISRPVVRTARASWRPVIATATDAGSGVASVRVRVSQVRNGVWMSWNGNAWVGGTSATVAAVRVPGTTRWTLASPVLALGPLVVTARARDRAGLVGPLTSANVTLTS